MSDIDLLQAIQRDRHLLDTAAAAMYKIREPRGSTHLSFDQISPGKQARNRELAIQILGSVLTRYPDPSKISDPSEIKIYMAEQMYTLLAPRKSEIFPFDQRTQFARSYYQERAERFMYEFLLPFAYLQRPQVTDRQVERAKPIPSVPATTGFRKNTKVLPTSKSEQAHSLNPPSRGPASSGPGNTPITEGQREVADSSRSAAIPIQGSHSQSQEPLPIHSSSLRTKSKDEGSNSTSQPTPPTSAAWSVVGCLLVVVAILLVILIIRTF